MNKIFSLFLLLLLPQNRVVWENLGDDKYPDRLR